MNSMSIMFLMIIIIIIIIMIIIIIIKQSLRRKHPSRKHVVFREVLHKNKKGKLKSKIKKYKCHRSKNY